MSPNTSKHNRVSLRRVALGTLIGANLLGGVLLLGGGSALAAAKTGKTPHALYGKVASRSGSTFKLVVRGKTLTVDTSSSTRFKEPSVSAPTIANVVAGLTVGVRGTESSGTPLIVTAAAVFISPVNHSSVSTVAGHKSSAALSVSGVASNIGADGFTLRAGSTVLRVSVSSSTQYFENSVAAPTLADLTTGSTVGVTGVADPKSTTASPLLDASAAYLGPPPSAPPVTTTTTPSPTSTTTAHSSGGAPQNTAAGELSPGATVSNVTSTSFTYTLGSRSVTVEIEPYTEFFLNGNATTASSLTDAGVTVGTSGVADPASTSANPIVDANHVYLSTTPPAASTTTTTTTPHTTTSTLPPNTAAGELSPGGTVSNVTSTSFTYTLGSKSVTVEIESYTEFFLNGNATTASSLTDPGVTVGTSGHADPSSTSGNLIVDANHVYLTS